MFWIFVIGLLCDSFKLSTNEYVYAFHCIFLLILFFWCSNLNCLRTKRKYKRKKRRTKYFKDRNETETELLFIGTKKHKKRIKQIKRRQYYLPYKSSRSSKPSKGTLTRAYNVVSLVDTRCCQKRNSDRRIWLYTLSCEEIHLIKGV